MTSSKSLRDALPFLKFAPTLVYESAMHLAFQRNASEGWDLKTHLTVAAVKKLIEPNGLTIEQIQERSKKSSPLAKGIEAVPVTITAPEDQTKIDYIIRLIRTASDRITKETSLNVEPTIPDATVSDVPAEWLLHERHESEQDDPLVTANDAVIIYAHGGAHYMGSAAGHRFITGTLAATSKAKVLSLDYRLSPQNPVPSAITDVLVSYLYVIETLHVPANKVFFAGDSSGGCLILGALEVLLYGEDNEKKFPIPAGIISISPWIDQTRSLPSESSIKIGKYDYIPPANYYPLIKESESWPVENKRYWHYAENNAIIHPLVSPILTPSWRNAPPLLVIVSEERLLDSGLLLAKFYKESGNKVRIYFHEKLPHVLHLLGPDQPSVAKSYAEISNFIKAIVQADNSTNFEQKEVTINLQGSERPLDRQMLDLTYDQLKKRMLDRVSEINHLLPFLLKK
ncbi:Alpha/Beta hydrolase protein [Lipomyces japonicus]|uniref:Alpha/Beta hydrolase protein n=1 Tax=Lipomyces japonicus TaxID=56871 RepID=UPI0034CE22BC